MKRIAISLSVLSLGLPVLAEDRLPEVKPFRNLLYTSQEIQKVREQVATDPLMKEVAGEFVSKAKSWTKKSQEEIERLIPPDDAVFAFGFAGDPTTGQPWPRQGKEICSLDRPFAVISPHTKAVYGTQREGEAFYDDGKGWVNPEGKRFYFRGIWNAFIVRALHDAVDSLSVGYMLTGDPACADRAILILDRLATLRSRRAAGDGPVDYPGGTKPGQGFFAYYGNLANERMFASALAFDLVAGSPAASLPSSADPKMSRFENIRQHYFEVFQKGLIQNGKSFHNHATAAYAASIAEGLLFGLPDAIARGIEAARGFLDNAVDRDGEYFEVSASYANLGRLYGGRMLSLFSHYAPENYSGGFPLAKEVRFGDDPAWYKTAVISLYRQTVLGRPSQYGDAGPDRYTPDGKPFDLATSTLALQRVMFLKLFYSQTNNPLWKDICAKLYWALPERARNNKGFIRGGILQYGPSQWIQPPRPQKADPLDLPPELQERFSTVAGQKRIAILRSGEGVGQRAVFMRGGSGNQHGHDDQMAISLYANGLSLTGEYGYSLYGTPDHRGYGTQAIAHQTVVVDEAHGRNFGASYPPARIEGYLPFGPAQFIEMANPALWPKSDLSEYRRETWLVDLSGAESYFVDFFRVEGGRLHDYVWTAPYLKPSRENVLTFEGVEPKKLEGVWSLAGLDPANREAVFNTPGKSWGERLDVATGTIRSVKEDGRKLPLVRWTPPPGNGYGFIWDVKAEAVDHTWSATWLLHDLRHSMRMTMLTAEPQTVIEGKAPTLAFGCHQDVVIARRKAKDAEPLKSFFITVTQTGRDGQWPLGNAEAIPNLPSGSGGVLVPHRDGSRDLILTLRGDVRTAVEGIELQGRHAFVRRAADGKTLAVVLNEGTEIDAGDVAIQLPESGWSGNVTEVETGKIALDFPLPPNSRLRGQPVFFSSPEGATVPYSSNEFFLIESVSSAGLLEFDLQSPFAGRLKIEEKQPSGELTAAWANELAAVLLPNADHARIFAGHLLRDEADPQSAARIIAYPEKQKLVVDSPQSVETGRYYNLLAVAVGDQVRIPSLAIVKRGKEENTWELQANRDVRVRLNPNVAIWQLRTPSNDRGIDLRAGKDGWIKIPAALLPEGSGSLTLLEHQDHSKK